MSEVERKYLIFALDRRRYALDLSEVAEVIEPPPTWPIPGAPPYYSGAMNFHGSIVAIMDLAAFLGLAALHGPEKVVVLHPGVGALAFLVERVERIVPADQVRLDNTASPPPERFSSGTLCLAEGAALLLDAVAITRAAGEALQAYGAGAGRG